MRDPVPLLWVAVAGVALVGVGIVVAVGRYLDWLAPTLAGLGAVLLVVGAVPGIALSIYREEVV